MKRMGFMAAALAVLLTSLACGKPAVQLQAQEQANAGSELTIQWTGANTPGDCILVRHPGQAQGVRVSADQGSPVQVLLPLEAGDYEIAYLDAQGKILSTRPLTITSNTYTLEAVEQVGMGEGFEVHWTGPSNPGDYITLVPAGAPEGSWESYAYTRDGSPLMLQAPLRHGDYEIRYSTEQVAPNPTLHTRPILVLPSDFALSFPTEVMAGSRFFVEWAGPDNQGDYLTIVPKDSPEGVWDMYAYTSQGNPAELVAPLEPGNYEVRYSTEQRSPNPTLAAAPVFVMPMAVTLEVVGPVHAGAAFEVIWSGPDGPSDYITIVPAGAPEGAYLSYNYTHTGSPLTLDAPEEPGAYEVRYASDRESGIFASIPVLVE